MLTRKAMMVCMIMIFGLVQVSKADEPSWWNPLSWSQSSSTANDQPKSKGMKPGNVAVKPKEKAKKSPGVYNKVSKTTKSWWDKTCEILAPYPTNEDDRWSPATTGEWQAGERIKH
jgi:hypothetical protein